MGQPKRYFSAEFKTKVVLDLLRGDKTLNQVASLYGVLPRSLASWKKQFLDNASLAFEPAKIVSEYKEQVKDKDAEIEELQKQLGKSVVEVEWLRKKLASLGLSERKSFVESGQQEITLTRQCELLSMARSTLYYQPKGLSVQDTAILHRMDEIYIDTPFYGHRRIWQ